MGGLQEDLVWLAQIDHTVPVEWSDDLTVIIDQWQQGGKPWKAQIKRAWNKHIAHETMMLSVHSLHDGIFKHLMTHGAEFLPDPLAFGSVPARFDCHCGRTFTTAQGLSVHRRKAHAEFAPEHPYTVGATCPACLTFLWTSQRLQQHLAYQPRSGAGNPCFQHLVAIGFQGEYVPASFPVEVHGLPRKDALPALGPHNQSTTVLDRQLQALRQEIARVQSEFPHMDIPPQAETLALRLGEVLEQRTRQWCARFLTGDVSAEDLADEWLSALASLHSDYHVWAEHVFSTWGTHWLPDVLASLVDGEVENVIDDAFGRLLSTLPVYELQLRLQGLLRREACLLGEQHVPMAPHRPLRLGPAFQGARLHPAGGVPRLLRDRVRAAACACSRMEDPSC